VLLQFPRRQAAGSGPGTKAGRSPGSPDDYSNHNLVFDFPKVNNIRMTFQFMDEGLYFGRRTFLEVTVPNVKNNAAAQETRKQLMEAAGQVFAERGFHQATIKEITDLAGASLASVNYHFKDKAELYAAVIRNVICDSSDLLLPDDKLKGTPEEKLGQFLQHFMQHLLHKEGCGSRCRWWERVLVASENAQRSPTLDPLVEGVVRPLSAQLARLASEVAGRKFNTMETALITSSIMGQCLHYMDHREIIARLYPNLEIPGHAEVIAGHITNFSIAGIRAVAGKGKWKPRAKSRRQIVK
jgi:AcrR family transcriptional regulator